MSVTTSAGARPAADLAALPDLMTRPQLAEYLGISVVTLAQWAVAKKGPPVTKIGQSVRYRRETVSAWLEANTAAA